MKNAESLKAKIREIALKKHLNSMEVLQMYFFERFLDRLSKSKYKFNFVINNPDASVGVVVLIRWLQSALIPFVTTQASGY